MIRRVIKVNEDSYSGCDACVDAYHKGATAVMDGKARLIEDDYCDRLGDCLPTCPTGVVTFEEREVAAYDGAAVKARMHQSRNLSPSNAPLHRECPESRLTQRPVQTKPTLVQAPYPKDVRLLIVVSCATSTYGDSHNDFIAGRIILISRPRPDMADYSEKSTEIIRLNDIRDATIVRMEVPCCSGIENVAKHTPQASERFIPWQVVIVRTDGSLVRSQTHDIKKMVWNLR